MNFDLDSFGEELKKTREGLHLTLNKVSQQTGVNAETIRRIESGKVIPKFETLEFLSAIYKKDLSALFLTHRLENYYNFHEIKNRLEAKLDRDEFSTLHIELEELVALIKCINPYSYYRNQIEQLILLIEAIIFYKQQAHYQEAFNKLSKALRTTSPDFLLDKYEMFIYAPMEIRILMNMSFVLNKLNKPEKYQELMEFCIRNIDEKNEMYPKLCHNLAGVYRRSKNFIKALEYSDMGIKACKNTRNLNGLNLLYYGKGISEYFLEKSEYMETLHVSLYLCEALGQIDLKNTILNNCKDIWGIPL